MFIPPPLVLFLAVTISFFASKLAPSLQLVLGSFQWLGTVLIAVGILLFVWSKRYFASHKTTIRPRGKPSRLITSGPYRFSRNPIYLGFLLISMGFAMLFSNILALVGPLLFFYFIRMFIVPFEEDILTKTFGDAYQKYRTRTRRWV